MREGAGNFPYTVELYRPKAGATNDLGHKSTTYKLRGRAAARVWTNTVGSTSGDAAEMSTRKPRLLLFQPLSEIEAGWRLMWKGRLWQISATDEREFNLLVDLDPVAA